MNHVDESCRLRMVAQQTRLRTITTELSLAFTWCSVARTEAELGEADQWRKSLSRIKSAAVSLRRRIHDPAQVPQELLAEFQSQLSNLEAKIEELEAAAKFARY